MDTTFLYGKELTTMRLLGLLIVTVCLLVLPVRAEWYKGNTHSHTINSDGDSAPDAVGPLVQGTSL